MHFYEAVIIVILIHSLILGFQQGLPTILLRLVKYSGVFLLISYLLPPLTHRLVNILGLKETIYVSLLHLLPISPKPELVNPHHLKDIPSKGVQQNLIFLVEELQLSAQWEGFLLFFSQEGQKGAFLQQVFQDSTALLHLDEISLAIFSYTAAFYFLFAFLALFSFFLLWILLEAVFPKIQRENVWLGGRFLAAPINLALTLFLIFFLLQVTAPLLEFFTLVIPAGSLLQVLRPIWSVMEHWHQMCIL